MAAIKLCRCLFTIHEKSFVQIKHVSGGGGHFFSDTFNRCHGPLPRNHFHKSGSNTLRKSLV